MTVSVLAPASPLNATLCEACLHHPGVLAVSLDDVRFRGCVDCATDALLYSPGSVRVVVSSLDA